MWEHIDGFQRLRHTTTINSRSFDLSIYLVKWLCNRGVCNHGWVQNVQDVSPEVFIEISQTFPPPLTLYTPIPGSISVFLLDVGGWSCAELEDLNPFLVLAELLVVLVSGLISLTLLIVTVLLSLSVLVSIAAGEAGAEELRLSNLESVDGAELQATVEGSLVVGFSESSVCERISSWMMSLRPTL